MKKLVSDLNIGDEFAYMGDAYRVICKGVHFVQMINAEGVLFHYDQFHRMWKQTVIVVIQDLA